MIYVVQPWTDNVTPVDKAHMDHIEAGIAAVESGLKPSYGTTLPGSPVDGQEAILVDSVTNPSYQWRFRYNAGSTSPYKWEFVGGASAWNGVVAAISSANPADWYPAAPSFVIPRSGEYLFAFWATITLGNPPLGNAMNQQVSLYQAGAGNAGNSSIILYTPGNMANQIPLWIESIANSGIVMPCTGGEMIQLAYYAPSVDYTTFSQRNLVVTPKRVS